MNVVQTLKDPDGSLKLIFDAGSAPPGKEAAEDLAAPVPATPGGSALTGPDGAESPASPVPAGAGIRARNNGTGVDTNRTEWSGAKSVPASATNYHCEAVLLVNDKGRTTACLSSQIGCAMGCRFCATGRLGLTRNLGTAEILRQFDELNAAAVSSGLAPVNNVVFMGMGEALHNLDQVLPAVDALRDPKGRNIFPRRITISTAGYFAGMKRLADYRPALGLAFSLISAREEVRRRLIPSSFRGFTARAKDALLECRAATGKRIVLEMVIFAGVNHDEAEARALAAFADGMDCIVNLIPWNPINSPPELNGLPLAVPREVDVHAFAMMLSQRGIANTVRYTRGREIQGACGQLGDRMI